VIALALALALLAGQAAPQPAAPAPATPAPPAVELPFQVRAEKTAVKLGEPFAYQIEVRHPAALTVTLPAELPQDPFLLEPGRCRRAEADGEMTTTCALKAALFALGPHDLPALTLAVTGPDGVASLKVPGPSIQGEGVLDPAAPADKLELRALAPPAPLLVRSLRLLWWALGLLAAAALAWAAWLVWRRLRARGVEAPPPLPPHERFARRLASLEADRLGERGHAREHFYRLSELVRDYLGALLGVAGLDLTTEELLRRVSESGDPRLEPEWLRPFLEDVDLVKFARAPAGPGECASGIAFARALLERTAPPPAAAEPAVPARSRERAAP
jgi:hypothetical protein